MNTNQINVYFRCCCKQCWNPERSFLCSDQWPGLGSVAMLLTIYLLCLCFFLIYKRKKSEFVQILSFTMSFKKALGMINMQSWSSILPLEAVYVYSLCFVRLQSILLFCQTYTINSLCFVRLDSQSPSEGLFPGDSGSMASHEKEQLWKVNFLWFHYDFCSLFF